MKIFDRGYTIQDDFLDTSTFDAIRRVLVLGGAWTEQSSGQPTVGVKDAQMHESVLYNFPGWSWGPTDYSTSTHQLSHWFYVMDKMGVGQITSPYFDMMRPLILALKLKVLFRLKANANPPTANIIEYGYHTDINYIKDDNTIESLEGTTSIFYLNTNNGYTTLKIKDTPKIESVANRLLSFPSVTEHKGSSCTDKQQRVVLNINYIE